MCIDCRLGKIEVRRTIMVVGESIDRRNVALFHAFKKCYYMRFVCSYIPVHHLFD